MRLLLSLFFILLTCPVLAGEVKVDGIMLTNHWVGYAALAIFSLSYVMVIFEEKLHMRKSKLVLLAANSWGCIDGTGARPVYFF